MSPDVHERPQRLLGVLGEFESANALRAAGQEARLAGFAKVDAFSPYPIHGMDEALGVRKSRLPWFVLVAGILGGSVAWLGQWWTSAVDYPLIISGKPLFSVPSSVPVTFEVIILCGAFAAFFGMLALNGLPRIWNPLHGNPRFARVTTDGFFLFIEASTDDSIATEARSFLESTEATSIEECWDEAAPPALPKVVFLFVACFAALALVPPVMIARARSTTSERPPLRTFKDMDFQPKRKAQSTAKMFSDDRAMRPPVAGVVARGDLQDDDHLYRGIKTQPKADDGNEDAADSSLDEPGEPSDDRWAASIPIAVTDQLMQQGRVKYNTFCAACHGRAGDGDGPVSVRALELEQGTWVPPTSIHAQHVREQPAGKLFNTITNGIRKMPGYGDAIPAEERWGIVLYLKALQRTRTGSVDDLPMDSAAALRDLN